MTNESNDSNTTQSPDASGGNPGVPEDDRLNSSGTGVEEAVADVIDPDSDDAAGK